MKTTLISLALLLAVTVIAEPEGLATLRTTYKDQMTKINDEEMIAISNAQDQYMAALSGLEKKFQAAGMLEPLLKAQQERERFSADRVVAAKDVSLDVADIAALQKQYVAAVKAVPLGSAQKKITLAGFYERSLKKLEADLTRQNDIQGALAVKGERDGLAKREEIVNAQDLIAQHNKSVAAAMPAAPAVKDVPAVEEVPKLAPSGKVDKSRIQSEVKSMFNDFIDLIEDQDWDSAVEMIDPEYVRSKGEDITSGVLKMNFAFIARMTADNPAAKIRAKEIDVDDSGEKVALKPELWMHNRGRDLPKMTWVPVDGKWYISLAGQGGSQPGGHNQPVRKPGKRPAWHR